MGVGSTYPHTGAGVSPGGAGAGIAPGCAGPQISLGCAGAGIAPGCAAPGVAGVSPGSAGHSGYAAPAGRPPRDIRRTPVTRWSFPVPLAQIRQRND